MSEIRELFVEDLMTVQGGASAGGPYTTMACCEEGPFGCCGWLDKVEELLKP
ncbi:MAG: hypothetical protein ABR613_10395 [Actinomycetota bacterium]